MAPSLPGKVGIILKMLLIVGWNSLLSLTVIATPVVLSQRHICIICLAVENSWVIDY
jgi:hypothetical protein